MSRRNVRMCIRKDGSLEVLDPGPECLSLLSSIDPALRLLSTSLPGFSSPRFQKARQHGCGMSLKELAEQPEQKLWETHGQALSMSKSDEPPRILQAEEGSLLDLTVEIAWRLMLSCSLCANRCNVNRTQGEFGRCGLHREAWVAEHFLHVGEESLINPSVLLNLVGCGLRCRYCNKAALLEPAQVSGIRLDSPLWRHLGIPGARSLSFAGGSPDESTHSILRFLNNAHDHWELPVVWNCHAYQSQETLRLLEGIVDVYLADFKYADETCGSRLSLVHGYPVVAKRALQAMILQNVPVIVRIPVLSGHFECCHAPALEFLSTLQGERLFVSVRGEYTPDSSLAHHDAELARRPRPEEIEAVRQAALRLGLQLVV